MRNALIKLHISVILAGFTGIFGKLVALPEVPLVWYRMLLTVVMFAAFMLFSGRLHKTDPKELAKIAGSGALLGLHWIFFYGSIKYANVSVGVVCFALTGFFTALIEPLVYKRPLSARELCFSVLTLAGVALIFHFDTRYRLGIALGVISAALAAAFTVYNKILGQRHAASVILFYQMLGGFCFVSLVMPLNFLLFPAAPAIPTAMDFLYLFLLSSLCTIVMFLLELQALQHISAFTASLTFNLEPVYSIGLAMLIFGEAAELGPPFYAGLALICLSVVLQTLRALQQRPAFLKP
ncbi:MAG: DMT family transporter [Deltaproteobacteria bacterium]|jgi:drug/metabolite transporter (DMT)-like permease|nr:DMT family transporter [Deltaproteobacteria bacterium]